MHPIRDCVEHESSWKQRTGHPPICTALPRMPTGRNTHVTRASTGSQMGEIDENGLHPVVRMHDNLTVMATIARKCETLCEFISKKYFNENKWR